MIVDVRLIVFFLSVLGLVVYIYIRYKLLKVLRKEILQCYEPVLGSIILCLSINKLESAS